MKKKRLFLIIFIILIILLILILFLFPKKNTQSIKTPNRDSSVIKNSNVEENSIDNKKYEVDKDTKKEEPKKEDNANTSNNDSNEQNSNTNNQSSNNTNNQNSNSNNNSNTQPTQPVNPPAPPTPTYSCPNGYELNGTTCTEVIAANEICPDGMWPSIGDYCINPSDGIETQGDTCPDGYTILGHSSLGAPTYYLCHKLYDKSYACDNGYTLNNNLCTKTIPATVN